MVYDGLGREAEAQAYRKRTMQIVERHLEFNPDDARALYMGATNLCALGEREKSMEWAGRALALDTDSSVLYNVACTYARLGEPERALDCLEQSVRNGFGHREWMEHDSDLESLRDLPRFRTLLEQI